MKIDGWYRVLFKGEFHDLGVNVSECVCLTGWSNLPQPTPS